MSNSARAAQAFVDAYNSIIQQFYDDLHRWLDEDADDWDRVLDYRSQIEAVETLAERLNITLVKPERSEP